MNEDILVPGMFFLTVIILVVAVPLIRARIRQIDRKAMPSSDPDAQDRLMRIEQAVDAMAVEIERVSEGQRFVTRMLSERAAEPIPLPRQPSDRT